MSTSPDLMIAMNNVLEFNALSPHRFSQNLKAPFAIVIRIIYGYEHSVNCVWRYVNVPFKVLDNIYNKWPAVIQCRIRENHRQKIDTQIRSNGYIRYREPICLHQKILYNINGIAIHPLDS